MASLPRMRIVVACLLSFLLLSAVFPSTAAYSGEDWLQFKYDCRHSGNVADRSVTTPLGLVGAVPMTDALFTAPVVADGQIYVVDGSGVAFCIDAATLRVVWKVETRGGSINCNNISSPAIVGRYLHFGTMAGSYCVLDRTDGRLVAEIVCGEPIFSTPVVVGDRAYFATLGSQVYAVEPNGTVCWTWDFVKDYMKFPGNRWSSEDWLVYKKAQRVNWRDQFACSRNLAAHGKMLVIPSGGELVYLEDTGGKPEFRGLGTVPSYKGREAPATFGLSIGADGTVYRQWHRRDNSGRVEMFRLRDGKMEIDFVPGTIVRNDMPGLLSFSSVSLRGDDVYRCRPERGFGCSKHVPGQEEPQYLGGFPSITPPILLRDTAVYGGLDGSLYVVPLSGGGKPWSFATAFGKAISAPACVCDGRIYFGCEDGYLYVLGPDGKAALPSKELDLCRIRNPLKGKLADPKYDWYTAFADMQSTNANDQGIKPPFNVKWIRRYEGTFKHLPVCGGGRMYTHTAEGQIMAVEQDTGRLLWRRYWPGVNVCYTAPLYYKGRLLIPQAGLDECFIRCLDAATGELLWEAPFSGSPSWSRQMPPVVHDNLAFYMFGTGKYAPKGTGIYVFRGEGNELAKGAPQVMSWLYSHDNPHYPKEHKPLVRAWDFDNGKVAWTKDFSEHGSGGDDAGLCIMDGTLYYSVFFGYAATRKGQPGPKGLTAAMDPKTGRVLWLTTKYSVTAGCTISAEKGRLYVGGYNSPNSKKGSRHVWCLDARDGSLVWESDPLIKSTNIVTVGERFIFAYAYGGTSYLLDKANGKILSEFNLGYACTRFSLSEPYLLGTNTDLVDTSKGNVLVSVGPPLDTRDCVGSVVSNGRIFFTAQASGLQMSKVCGDEATSVTPWPKAANK